MICTGPESSGTKSLSLLMQDFGFKKIVYMDELTENTNTVIHRSMPNGNDQYGDIWPDFTDWHRIATAKGFYTVFLISARDPVAVMGSQIKTGHTANQQKAFFNIQKAYKRIMLSITETDAPYFMLPLEAFLVSDNQLQVSLAGYFGIDNKKKHSTYTNQNLKYYEQQYSKNGAS